MTQKIPELDGLRALAVLPVIAFHFTYLRYVVGGYLGVDLFFVLSGFLITSLLLFLVLGARRTRFLGWVILVVLAVRIVLLSMKMDVYTPTYTRADSLAVGCYAALAMAAKGKPQWGAWVAPAALAGVTLLLLF